MEQEKKRVPFTEYSPKQESKMNALATMLSNIKGATIMTITTLTAVKMNKRGNPLANENVTKLAIRNCQFGYSYANAVNNRIEKQSGEESNFVAEPRKWGKWVEGMENKAAEHNGNYYGRFYLLNNNVSDKVSYFVNGIPATAEQVAIIKEFTLKSAESNRQAEAGLVENQVKPFEVNLDNILEIKVGGGVVYTKSVVAVA